MVEIPILKFLFSDDMSLQAYLNGEIGDFTTVRRRILMEARSKNTRIPDHHYHLTYEYEVSRCKSIRDLILTIGRLIADNYLVQDTTTGEIHVQNGKQCEWHQIIPFVPPLFAKASFLFFKTQIPNFNNEAEVWKYCESFIKPACQYSAIPPATSPSLNGLKNSFADIHIHLNGSVESDVLWQDFLEHPSKIYRELSLACQKSTIVVEQLEQESHLLKPLIFHDLLRGARKMRKFFYDFINASDIGHHQVSSISDLFHKLLSGDDREFPTSNRHPFQYLIPLRFRNECPKMVFECLMFISIMDYMSKSDGTAESFFHAYFLIYGLSNKLVVHQPYQFGFDQFQKITLNRLRELTEQSYENRFLQICGNQLDLINTVEGRISPKLTQQENISLISQIEKGWTVFLRQWNSVSHGRQNEPVLNLIAHFIKQPDDNKSNRIRHYNLRTELWQRAKNIRLLVKRSKYKALIVGIDAASNELHTPPEVFAPVFWKLRQHSIDRATFHVGEDFVHPLNGIRAIYEAVEFLGLVKGDRIGHGTALGIDLLLWGNSVGRNLFIRIGVWVDNLIFILSLRQDGYNDPNINYQRIEEEVITLCSIIYKDNLSVNDLIESWRYRKYCPILSLSKPELVRNTKVFDQEYFDEIEQNRATDSVLSIFRLYHNVEVRRRYDAIVKINPFDLVSMEAIKGLQDYMLTLLHQREIAIETLPTSNIRISCAKDFSEYHFINWENKVVAGQAMPKIIVGTDDPGIFSTNLLNEFACIHELLMSHCKYSPLNASKRIAQLVSDAQRLKF